MKSNAEFRELAWKRLWADKWFGRLFGGGLLLGLCGYAVQVVISCVLGRLHVQSWQDYAQAVVMNRQDLTTPVPNLTPGFISQASSSTVLILFFSYLMAGIAAYGGATILRKCLANDERDWLKAAFGGFRWPFEMLWMYVRLLLTYVGWFLLGAIPLAAVAMAAYARFHAWIGADPLVATAAASLGAMVVGTALLLLLCVPFYRYRFLFLVKSDSPELGANACFRRCRELMKGNLMRSFRLDCSYWRPITGVMFLCLALTVAVFLITRVPTVVQLALGAFLFVGLAVLFVCSIILSLYIGVGQGFLYREIENAMSESGGDRPSETHVSQGSRGTDPS